MNLIWDLIYFNLIQNEVNTNNSELFITILFSYFGNNLVNGSRYFSGINVNKYFITSFDLLSEQEEDVKKINCSAVCDLIGHTIKCITDSISCCWNQKRG